MVNTALGPRILLRRLREVMAEGDEAQHKLDRIAVLIAANMVAEVCSIYVMRDDGVLELFATEGLKPEAVHRTRMQVDEGLVGTIARETEVLNLSDAQAHPAFKYFPETGEEIYSSFLGVPILRSGRTIGVLVVQNRTMRHYSEDEEEALQITATVLAELIAAGPLRELAEKVAGDIAHIRSHHVQAEALTDGIALGHVVLHEPRVVITRLIADDIPAEMDRLDAAISSLREGLDELIETSSLSPSGEPMDVLETIRMFAHDRGWVRRIKEVVNTGLTAEAAVERVQSDNRARMLKQADPYLRERMHDLDEIADRLLRILTGQQQTGPQSDLPKDAVVVARSMGAATLLDYDRERLRAVVLEEAGRNSHVAIVARALGIPALGQASDVTEIVDMGDAIIVDSSVGEIHVRPTPDIEAAYAEKVRFYARRRAKYAASRDQPAVTRNGVPISLKINAGLHVDLPQLAASGADGVGLYRTELQFMLLRSFPRQQEQADHYRKVLDLAEGKPVVFRSLDIGSDKMLPYLRYQKENNPAMGWRAIRIALDRPALLRMQLRGLLLAAGERDLNLMFPMVAEPAEFLAAKELLENEKQFLAAHGHSLPRTIKLGAMVEVPSILWQLDQFLPMLDFASIGSNDLIQFLFASDREHPRLAQRFDPLSPAVLSVIKKLVDKSAQYEVPLNLCGEMAGRPLEALALLGLGMRSISMSPTSIGPIKAMVRSVDLEDLTDFLLPLLNQPVHSLRSDLQAYAEKRRIVIDG